MSPGLDSSRRRVVEPEVLEAKAVELDVTKRTLQRWIANYRRDGEAGLAQTLSLDPPPNLM